LRLRDRLRVAVREPDLEGVAVGLRERLAAPPPPPRVRVRVRVGLPEGGAL
jgi:hypothetical protein